MVHVTNNLHEKPEEWLPFLAHKLKILNKTFKYSNGACSLIMRYISFDQMRQIMSV